MSSLRSALHLLRNVATLSCLNIYAFNASKRTFICKKRQHRWLRLLLLSVLTPVVMYLFLIVLLAWTTMTIRVALDYNFSSEGLLMLSYALAYFGTTVWITTLNIYIVFQSQNQRTRRRLRELLNAFLRVHDQYVDLFEPALRLNWCILLLLLVRIVFFDAVMLAVGPLSGLCKCSIVLFLPQTLVYTLAALTALVLLHALYGGAQRIPSALLCQQPHQPGKLLHFYRDLLRLHADFEAFTQFLFGMEMIVNHLALMSVMHFHLLGIRYSWIVAGTLGCLLYPLLFVHLTHEINVVRDSLGNQLLAFDAYQVNRKADREIELFCLSKCTAYGGEETLWPTLYLRRSFLLALMQFGWINSMLLNSFYLTTYIES